MIISNNNNNDSFPKAVSLSSLTNTVQLTVAQLANLLAIETTEKLTTNDTKAYCTLIYEIDRAKAGYYTASKDKPHLDKNKFLPSLTDLPRLAQFADMKLADFKASIEKLIKHKAVVKFKNGVIFPRREALSQIPRDIINALTGDGKCDINRSFIITKEQLSFLITSTKSFALTTLLYAARAIRIVDSVVRLAGSVKVNWLAKLAGVSERTVQRVRQNMISLGWISDDNTKQQWKLNKHGHYFVFNIKPKLDNCLAEETVMEALSLKPQERSEETQIEEKNQEIEHCITEDSQNSLPVDNFSSLGNFVTPPDEFGEFCHPHIDTHNPYGIDTNKSKNLDVGVDKFLGEEVESQANDAGLEKEKVRNSFPEFVKRGLKRAKERLLKRKRQKGDESKCSKLEIQVKTTRNNTKKVDNQGQKFKAFEQKDICIPKRMEAFYWYFVDSGVIEHSEAECLSFCALIKKARTFGYHGKLNNPLGFIISQMRLPNHQRFISDNFDQAGHQLLKDLRDNNPNFLQVRP